MGGLIHRVDYISRFVMMVVTAFLRYFLFVDINKIVKKSIKLLAIYIITLAERVQLSVLAG